VTTDVLPAGQQLRASQVSWKRLRRLLVNAILATAAVGAIALYLNSAVGGFLLNAHGVVARDHVIVAPSFEGRIVQVFVHPGDAVTRGQKIAVVESASVGRDLSEVSQQMAQLITHIADVNARRRVIEQILPMAETSSQAATGYLRQLMAASLRGLVVSHSLQEMSAAALDSAERLAALQAQQSSLATELQADMRALAEVTLAYDNLNAIYKGGILYANSSGDIGSTVAPVGQTLTAGGEGVADIYMGKSYVLAYIPNAYLPDIAEGQKVGVTANGTVLNARIERILPITATLPRDLQRPNKALERGRLVRIALLDPNYLSLDQEVRITRCYADDCRLSLLRVAWQQARMFIASADDKLSEKLKVIMEAARRVVPISPSVGHRDHGDLFSHAIHWPQVPLWADLVSTPGT